MCAGKKSHRFLNLSRKSELIFPPDSGNSNGEKPFSNSPESSRKSLLKTSSILAINTYCFLLDCRIRLMAISSLNLKGGLPSD
jgi:hypothetical protein